MDTLKTSHGSGFDNDKINKNANLRYSYKAIHLKKFDNCCQRSEQQFTSAVSTWQKTNYVNTIVTKETRKGAVIKNKNICLRYSKLHRKRSFDINKETGHNINRHHFVSSNVCTKNKNATLRHTFERENHEKERSPIVLITKACNVDNEARPVDTIHKDPKCLTVPEAHANNSPKSSSGKEKNKNSCLRYSKIKAKYNEKQDSTSGEIKNSDDRYGIEKKQHKSTHRTSNVEFPYIGDTLNFKEQDKTKYDGQVIDDHKSKGLNKTRKSKACTASFTKHRSLEDVSLPFGGGNAKVDKINTDLDREQNTADIRLEKQHKANENKSTPDHKGPPEQDEKYKHGSNCNGHSNTNIMKDSIQAKPLMKRQLTGAKYLFKMPVVNSFTGEYLRKSLKEVEWNLSAERNLFSDECRKDQKLHMLFTNPLYPV